MPRTVAAGIGLMEFPFRTTSGFWRWVDLCEQGGVDSIWQSDRLVSRIPTLECMTALAAIAGRTRRIKFGVNVIAIVERITRYVENGASKFILRPAADGDEDMYAQTRRLVEEVLPRMAERWRAAASEVLVQPTNASRRTTIFPKDYK